MAFRARDDAVHTGSPGGPGTSPTLTHTGRPSSAGHLAVATLLATSPGWSGHSQAHSGEILRNLGGKGSVGAFGVQRAPSTVSAPPTPPGPELAPEPREDLHYALLGKQITHLHEIKAGQEGHAVLDHFALGLSFADIPAACPGCVLPGARCAAQPRRDASSSRKRPAPLMSHSPRAPLEPARCRQRPRLSPPLLQQPSGSQSEQGTFRLYSGCHPRFFSAETSISSFKLLLQWLPLSATLPLLSTALARLRGGRGLTSRIGKGGRTPGCCSREAEETRHPRAPGKPPGSLQEL